MRESSVVLDDVEVDQASKRVDRVELVQEEPLRLECPPPRLDHRNGRRCFNRISIQRNRSELRSLPERINISSIGRAGGI